MIVFDLACFCGCQFEGWFQDHDDFIIQQDDGLLLCPECGGGNIRKIMSAVAVRTGNACCSDNQPAAQQEPLTEEMVAAVLNKIQDYVEKNFEDVGTKLSEKALKIHYGVEEARNIRGIATPAEEKMLNNEGIKLLKIPMIKKEDEKLN